jgi:Tfp pilus assembly protein PilO
MNFKKLPREKKQQLILVVLLTLGVVAALGFGLIKQQYQHLDLLAAKRAVIDQRLHQIRDAVQHTDRIEAELADAKIALAAGETDVASGDLYSWAVTALRRFKTGYKIDIPQLSPSSSVTDVNLLPQFPYRQTVFSVSGTATFHDLGRFLADLENQFPHVRVTNLSLEPNPGPGTGQEETLSFRMDLIVLVRPSAS